MVMTAAMGVGVPSQRGGMVLWSYFLQVRALKGGCLFLSFQQVKAGIWRGVVDWKLQVGDQGQEVGGFWKLSAM